MSILPGSFLFSSHMTAVFLFSQFHLLPKLSLPFSPSFFPSEELFIILHLIFRFYLPATNQLLVTSLSKASWSKVNIVLMVQAVEIYFQPSSYWSLYQCWLVILCFSITTFTYPFTYLEHSFWWSILLPLLPFSWTLMFLKVLFFLLFLPSCCPNILKLTDL